MRPRITPDERDAILSDLKQWPLISYDKIAAKHNRSPVTIGRLARAWGYQRKGR